MFIKVIAIIRAVKVTLYFIHNPLSLVKLENDWDVAWCVFVRDWDRAMRLVSLRTPLSSYFCFFETCQWHFIQRSNSSSLLSLSLADWMRPSPRAWRKSCPLIPGSMFAKLNVVELSRPPSAAFEEVALRWPDDPDSSSLEDILGRLVAAGAVPCFDK